MKIRLRQWSPLTLSMVGGVGLFLFGVIPSPHGLARSGEICIAVILVGLTFVGPDLARRNADEEARLAVEYLLDPPLNGIPTYEDLDGVVDAWVDSEREACLECLRPAPQPKADRKKGFTVDATGDGPTIADVMEYERRKEAGQALTPEETNILRDAQANITRAIGGASALLAFNMFSEPDKRTEDGYRREVESYLECCRDVISQSTERAYLRQNIGRFRIRLHNPTDRTYERVQVEVTIQGKIWAKLASDSNDPDPFPSRPRKFGQGRVFDTSIASIGMISPALLSPHLRESSNPLGPRIDNSNSTSISYPLVSLRAQGDVILDDVHLASCEPVGTILKGTWEATSTSADGRVIGNFELTVGEPIDRTVIIEKLATTHAAPEGDTDPN